MTFIVATNVIASRPPERRPTGTPHTRAKIGVGRGEGLLDPSCIIHFKEGMWLMIEKINKIKNPD